MCGWVAPKCGWLVEWALLVGSVSMDATEIMGVAGRGRVFTIMYSHASLRSNFAT